MEEEIIVDGVGLGVSDNQPYNKINILNESLDALASEVNGIDMDKVNNEIEMPAVSNIEVSNDLGSQDVSEAVAIETDEEKEQAELVKEITSEEDATNEPSSKGQYILIAFLSLVLIALLIAMVIFTNAL